MIQFRDIIAASTFKKSAKDCLFRLQTEGGPLMLTVHGAGAFVVDDLNSYLRLVQSAETAHHYGAVEHLINRVSKDGQ